VTLVVGENAAASDGIAAANIAATIGNLAYASETTTIESDPVVCETQIIEEGGAVVGEGSVVLSTTSTGYRGIIDQDKRNICLANKTVAPNNFYTDAGVIFGGGDDSDTLCGLDPDLVADMGDDNVTCYNDETGNFLEIKTTEVCEATTDQTRIEVLLDRDYVNNQCFLCYDICQDTVTDLEHEMYEQIAVNKDQVNYYEEGIADDDLDEALKLAVEGNSITYSVYADYLPPTFLKNRDGDLIDSRYRGKIIFLGDEYLVKDWDDDEEIVKLAKGAERTLDNKAFGGDYTAADGTYQFKVHRAIFSEDQVAGIIIDVKKPDGTEVQVVAQRSLNAVVGNVEIYASNVATAGEFVQADVKVYDLSTEIVLENDEWFDDNKQQWRVSIEKVPLGCVVDKLAGTGGPVAATCDSPDVDQGDDVATRFNDYQKASSDYEDEGMLKWIHMTLEASHTEGGDFDPLGIGDAIMFPLDAFQFSYEGFKTSKFVDPRCSGDDDKIEIKKDGDHQVLISFTDDNSDRYDDVHLDNGPIEEGELFMVDGEVWEFIEGDSGADPSVELKNRITGKKWDVELTDDSTNLDIECNVFGDGNTQCVDNKPTNLYAEPIENNGESPIGDIVYDGRYLYLTTHDGTGVLGLNAGVTGMLQHFDVDDNDLNIGILPEGGGTNDDLNREDSAIRNTDDVLITVSSGKSDVIIRYDGDIPMCDSTSCDLTYIDFYDKDRLDDDHWANSVLVVQSDGGVLDDEDNADTVWLPNSGAEIVVDYGSDDEINGVTICHPRTKVYQTYFIGSGKNETTSTVSITEADIGTLIPEIGYTVQAFGVSVGGGEARTGGSTSEVTNVTAVAECDTHTIMPIGNLVVSDASSPSGNLIIIGGDKANDMGLPGLAAGDSKVEVSGNKVYIAGYNA